MNKKLKRLLEDISVDTIDWGRTGIRLIWNCGVAFFVGMFVRLVMQFVILTYAPESKALGTQLAFCFVLMYLVTHSLYIYRKNDINAEEH
jgi:hypothetical protein